MEKIAYSLTQSITKLIWCNRNRSFRFGKSTNPQQTAIYHMKEQSEKWNKKHEILESVLLPWTWSSRTGNLKPQNQLHHIRTSQRFDNHCFNNVALMLETWVTVSNCHTRKQIWRRRTNCKVYQVLAKFWVLCSSRLRTRRTLDICCIGSRNHHEPDIMHRWVRCGPQTAVYPLLI